jgi:subtilisin family serine protease
MLATLPYDVVGDSIRQTRTSHQILTENLLAGQIDSLIEPAVAKKGEISADLAEAILWARYLTRVELPLKKEIVDVYQSYLITHDKPKPDIWVKRASALAKEAKYNPVKLAVWDTGLDVDLYKDRFAGGRAYDLDNKQTVELLMPLEAAKPRRAELFGYMKGRSDLEVGLDTPEAARLKEKLAGLKPEEVRAFTDDLRGVSVYSHGTHVAGITLEGNPFARLVAARYTFDYHSVPKPMTIEYAKKMAREWQETVDFLKEQHVRVTNMSWAWDLKEIERELEVNGIGKNLADRTALARASFGVLRDGLLNTLKGAPEILFVCAAGNSDNDVGFDEIIPSSFELPNLLVVGAVDQAGEPTGFTSYGKTVQVYANGYEVESYVPGGQRLRFSGTSMASPIVANLAGKILAIKSSLKPAEVIDLIKKGVTPAPGSKKAIPLIDPNRTLSLLMD